MLATLEKHHYDMLEQYPLYRRHLNDASRDAISETLIRLAFLPEEPTTELEPAEDVQRALSLEQDAIEHLDWIVIPRGELFWFGTSELLGACAAQEATGVKSRRFKDLDRIERLDQMRQNWADNGYETGTAVGIPRLHSSQEWSYRVVYRRRTLNGQVVEDAIADNMQHPNALYALRAEDGDWREIFQMKKSDVYHYFTENNIKGRIYHTGDYIKRALDFIG